MLGKTAGGLFWMSRQLERSENTVRMMEAGQRMALNSVGSEHEAWQSVMRANGGIELSASSDMTSEQIIDFMLRDSNNPSSVLSCFRLARENARMVRTAITGEVWEAVNAGWITVRDLLSRRVTLRELPQVIKSVRQHTSQVRGATHGTMLRNDIYDFMRVGTFIERADNTARILDVKYFALIPAAYMVGVDFHNMHWRMILQAVSAEGGYRMIHGDEFSAEKITSFMIKDARMPRSLVFCADKLRTNLHYIHEEHGDQNKSLLLAEALCAQLHAITIQEIMAQGLHGFLTATMADLSQLGLQFEEDYRFYV